ncbi:MAG: GH92 family glycosyl hydrolase [Calditrichaeota bacterium]|nr:GH92 family glycosyl hydrolase [Calditrichota bacterium]
MKLIIIIILCICIHSCSEKPAIESVDPFIGTGGHGHTFPGASAPFGMVQLSPDTRISGWDACSGYHYSDSTIIGFSHTHLSGTGAIDYGDILLMPFTGPIHFESGTEAHPESGYRSRFSHNQETASPGFYSVRLLDYGIDVDLTVTERVGFHRYRFDESTDSGHVMIDLVHGLGPDQVLESSLKIVNDSTISGLRRSKGWARNQYVYFVAQFSQPFVSQLKREGASETNANEIKLALTFDLNESKQILAKVALSAVDEDGALKNLSAEIPGWDFESIRSQTKKNWAEKLWKIEVEGGTADERTIFYTALYHSFLAPNLFQDVDGRYRGMDLAIHQGTKDFQNYTVFSLWDTFRATHPLFNLIDSKTNTDFIKSLISKYEEGGILPIWELAGNYTGTMIGYHAIPLIADAIIKGNVNFDPELAFQAMKNSAMQNNMGLAHYKEQGLIPADKEHESVSKALEYAYDDWCIAQVAKHLNKMDDYHYFLKRSKFYQNHFDSNSGFMRAVKNGNWVQPFDPNEVSGDYTEANAWQYTYFVPHDIAGLMKLMGGDDGFKQRLDDLFSASQKVTGRDQPDISGLIGQYAHGNEPSHHMAYLYSYAGYPQTTQYYNRRILSEMYSTKPDGLSGNEDCGQMSSWYVFSAMGFYPVTPGSDIYAIGSPIFKKVTIHLENGNSFTIKSNSSPQNTYIKSMELNETKFYDYFLKHSDIVNGGALNLEMTESDPGGKIAYKHRPSSSVSLELSRTPIIESGDKAYLKEAEITLSSQDEKSAIYYTLDGTVPTDKSLKFEKPFIINRSVSINAISIAEGKEPSMLAKADFIRIPYDRSITLKDEYSHLYTAGGKNGLIDFVRGTDQFKNGWQGFHEVDLDAVVDLGKVRLIKRLSAGFLHAVNSWIFLPREVKYFVSTDGKDFVEVNHQINRLPDKDETISIHEFPVQLSRNARFVRVWAKNMGICPDWHRGAGGQAWLFADEIIIDTN